MPRLGNTLKVKAILTDFDGAPLTPDTHEIKVYDPTNLLKETQTSPTLESSGVYYIKYTLPSGGPAGIWAFTWKVAKGADTATGEMRVPAS